MQVVITGGLGFLGRRLASFLLARGTLADRSGVQRAISRIVLVDIAIGAAAPTDSRISLRIGDIADADFVDSLELDNADSVFHLAALVSGGAEADFAAGYSANLFGTWNLLEAIRLGGSMPRLVFASSVAAYGGELPGIVADDQCMLPESSYGVQKVMGELLVNDLSRRGYLDGRSVRLPIIAIRPGPANTALSGWASALVREPVNGRDYACPVAPTDRGFLLSPRRAVEGIVLAHDSDADLWGRDRTVMMAGTSCTAGEIVEALGRVVGQAAADRISWHPDDLTRRVITSWPTRFTNEKARRIGLLPDSSIDEIVRNYVEEMGA